MTRLGSRLKRLEEVMAPANEDPIRIKVGYVGVNGKAEDGYEVVVAPRRRFGSSSSRGEGVAMLLPGRSR